MEQRDVFKRVAVLRRDGRFSEGLQLLQEALRRGTLDSEGVEKAGRLCTELFAGAERKVTARILVLAQCTATWFANVLTGVAWGQGVALQVVEGAYDNVMQELLAAGGSEPSPDLVLLLPWNQRLLTENTTRPAAERVDEECAFWRQAWQLISGRLGARIHQIGYDWMTAGALGYGLGSKADGAIALVRGVNAALRRDLPAQAFFTDLEQVSGTMGRDRFYDPRRYFWTKQPFSEAGTLRLAEFVWAGIRAQLTGPKKVLVLDLDNTLWGGVVGETGPLGIELGEGPDGEAFRTFQAHVKSLGARGVLLAVCSKNNDADARAPFQENPGMILALDDFAHFEASWAPKAAGIERIAERLSLGIDSFVFFDDNPAEREHIRQALPEVSVVDVPTDPAEYIRALDAGLWFEAVSLTEEDRQRAGQYQAETSRRGAESTFESIDAYLASLTMTADVRAIDDADFERVVQLIGKTNQFNLTTRRHSSEAVRRMMSRSDTIALTLRLNDRFGDHGLVSVLIALADSTADQATLHIDTWLMSCRVISRTVEEFLFNTLVVEARRRGAQRLTGSYIPTAKNGLVKDLYDRLGFTRCGDSASETVVYELSLAEATAAKTFVERTRATAEYAIS